MYEEEGEPGNSVGVDCACMRDGFGYYIFVGQVCMCVSVRGCAHAS